MAEEYDSIPLPKRRRCGRVARPHLHTLEDLDGRTRAAQKARELVAALESDMGGPEHLSVAERELTKHAALLGALVEDYSVRWLKREPVSIPDFLAAVNAERRLLMTIGLSRRAIDVTNRAREDAEAGLS
jgi:hypothetical protein